MAFLGASSSSFLSSSSTHSWTYDVFLSFRGEDTRNNFTSHLYYALRQNGINTYMDDNLKRGEEISSRLLKSIEQSRISIVVLSKNYASSRWCLDELSKILECHETKQQIVVPIFFDIDPSEVRNQTNSVGKAFSQIEARFKDDMKVQKWKIALREVANLSGWPLSNSKSEAEFIQEIIQWLNSTIIGCTEFHIANHLVGIKPRLQHLLSLLHDGKNDILMVGIYGIGGIGKTTFAKALYNSIVSQFDGTCFLPNVRETSQRNGLIYLQNQLLSKVLRVSSIEVDIVDKAITIMKQRFCSKKIFLVLDDVNKSIQLEKLAGRHDWFGSGSKIIITTRDKDLLSKHGVDLEYPMNELNDAEALELFSWNAFKSMKPPQDFVEITKKVLSYVKGLPLALEVMGSNLSHKSLQECKDTLDKYKRIPNKDIQNILRVSYDELDDNEKNIFLDIACFLVGHNFDFVCKVLDKFSPNHGIKVLENKSLITISDCQTLIMHDLLRDMGKEIVRQESQDPGECSRLWFHEDVRHVLEENTGTKKIQGILVDLPKEDIIRLSPEVFEKMRNLRYFLNHNAKFSTSPNFVSNKLVMLDWSGFSGEFLPSNFHGENLIRLNIHGSAFKMFQTIQNFQNLLKMEFWNCNSLKELPDISSIPNLEELEVTDCENLVTVHPSIVSHDKLRWLRFSRCVNLESLPRSLKMRSSSSLFFWDCPKLRHFPKIECPLELGSASLSAFHAEELPSSWEEPHLSGCTIVDNFLSMIYPMQSRHSIEFTVEFQTSPSAESLLLPPQTNSNVCNVGRALPVTSRCSSLLTGLDLQGTNIISLPTYIQDCCHLRALQLSDCRKLKEVPRLPPYLDIFWANNCESLENFRLSTCQSPWITHLELSGCSLLLEDIKNDIQFYLLSEDYPKSSKVEVSYSGLEIPDWFTYKKVAYGNSCEIDIIDLASVVGKIKGIVFCAVSGERDVADKPLNKFCFFEVICDGLEIYPEFISPFRLWSSTLVLSQSINIIFQSFESSKLKGDSLQVCFHFTEDEPKLVSCGVHLLLETEHSLSSALEPTQLCDEEMQDCSEDTNLNISSAYSAFYKFQGASSSSKPVNDKGKTVISTVNEAKKPQQLMLGESLEKLVSPMEIMTIKEGRLIKEVSREENDEPGPVKRRKTDEGSFKERE